MKNPASKSGIISLVVVLGVGLFALVAALGVASVVLAELTKGLNTDSGNRVFQSGESAMAEAIYRYLSPPTPPYSGPFIATNNSSGVIITTDNDVSHWPEVYITGVADNDLSNRIVKQTVNPFPEKIAFEKAVFAKISLAVNGSSQITGDIFSNGLIDIGNSSTVVGNASTNQTINDPGNRITGIKDPDAKKVSAPTFFQDIYISEGTNYSTAATLDAYLDDGYAHTGIIFCNAGAPCAPLEIDNPGTELNGTLGTLSNLKISAGKFTASNDHVAIFVVGNLIMTGGTINGIVYVQGNVSLSGNAKINGTLISGYGYPDFPMTQGIVSISGNAKVSFITNPSDWRNLLGLKKSLTPPPILTNWEEK